MPRIAQRIKVSSSFPAMANKAAACNRKRVGQLASSLAAWFFGRYPVDQGWRYFVVTIGIVTFAMFVVRFFIFHLFESPK